MQDDNQTKVKRFRKGHHEANDNQMSGKNCEKGFHKANDNRISENFR